MNDATATVLLLLALFQVKHMFADYFLQTPRMLDGREVYFHLGRAEHAGVHVLGSILVFLVVGAPTLFILAVVAGEWVAHFNIDWAKGAYSARKKLKPDQALYWRAAGFDQACHQMTYVAMAWAWAVFVG